MGGALLPTVLRHRPLITGAGEVVTVDCLVGALPGQQRSDQGRAAAAFVEGNNMELWCLLLRLQADSAA